MLETSDAEAGLLIMQISKVLTAIYNSSVQPTAQVHFLHS